MIAFLLNTLFALGGLTAIAAIRQTLRRYGRPAFALRQALRACRDTQDVHFSIRDVTVRAQARVLRPDFTVRKAEPLPQASLLAAA